MTSDMKVYFIGKKERNILTRIYCSELLSLKSWAQRILGGRKGILPHSGETPPAVLPPALGSPTGKYGPAGESPGEAKDDERAETQLP